MPQLVAHLLGHFCATRQHRRVVAAIFAIVGGFQPSNSLKKANCAQATCLTCSAKLRTPSNLPAVGINAYLSSGIASAMPRKLVSPYWRLQFTLSPIDFGRLLFIVGRAFVSRLTLLLAAAG